MKKPTTAQSWLGHSLEALAVMTAVSTVVVVLPQIQSGSFSWQGLGIAALSAGVTVASKYGASVLTNPQTPQALHDTVAQAVSQAIQAQPAPALPDVVINNHIPAAPTPDVVAPVGQVPAEAINAKDITTVMPAQPQFQQPIPTNLNTYPMAAIQKPQPLPSFLTDQQSPYNLATQQIPTTQQQIGQNG